MKKLKFHKFVILGGILLSGVLGGCATSEDGETKGSPVYQVDYFDEAGTQVGYAYAIEGKSGPFKSMDGTTYDWNPHTDMEITNPGSRFVFDEWVGTYDETYGKVKEGYDGQAIDLNHIQGDCKVVATFKEQAYKIETTFKNDGKTVDGGTKVDYGEPLLFPSTSPAEEKPEYYNDYNFTGWTLSADDSASKHVFLGTESPSYTWKAGSNVGQPSWGLGSPDLSQAAGNEGVIYLDKTLTDHMPLYEAFISTGSAWIDLGKLSTNSLKLEFISEYSKTYKDFTVTLFNEDQVTQVASFSATYASDISFDRSVSGTTTTIVVKCAGEAKHTYTLDTTDKISYLLEGKYLNRSGNQNQHPDELDNTKMSFSVSKDADGVPVGGNAALKGNVSIYPLVSDLH